MGALFDELGKIASMAGFERAVFKMTPKQLKQMSARLDAYMTRMEAAAQGTRKRSPTPWRRTPKTSKKLKYLDRKVEEAREAGGVGGRAQTLLGILTIPASRFGA